MLTARRLFVVVSVVAAGWIAFRALAPRSEITNRRPPSGLVICFGDSLTAGTGAGDDQSYPAHLARLLGRQVINAGVPGDTTASALARLERDVLAHSPGIVCITLGGNDLKNGVSRVEAFGNLQTIVQRLHAAGALVVLIGIDPPLLGRSWADAYRDLARRTGAILIPDVYQGIMGRPELMSDRIHPNGRGYRVLARRVQRAIAPYLP